MVELAERTGWAYVIPSAKGAKAAPRVNWATASLEDIEAAWKRYPDDNVAVLTGPKNGLIVLDVDAAHGGYESLEALFTDHKKPTTVSAKTGGGGLHLYFRYPSGVKIRNSAGKLGKGLDVRAEGGLVIAPPSLHPSGKLYEWVNAPWDTPLAPVPPWLLTQMTRVEPAYAEVYQEGNRNNSLASLSGLLHSLGDNPDTILQALSEVNDTAKAPLDQEELAKIVSNITKYPRVEEINPALFMTEAGNFELLLSKYGDEVRFTPGLGTLIWDKSRWVADDSLLWDKVREAVLAHRDFIRQGGEAAEKIRAWMRASLSKDRLKSLVTFVENDSRVRLPIEKVDSHPSLLGVANGVVDLKTGSLYENDPSLYLTRQTNVRYTPGAECPQWLNFLDQIFGGDTDLIDYAQRALGYSATGEVNEHCWFLCYGYGRNGKGTLVNTVQSVLGADYVRNVPHGLVEHSDADRGWHERTTLRGVRLAILDEISDRRLAEARLKELTGGSKLLARFLHKEFFEFNPTHKLWITANKLPQVTDRSKGFWSRVKVLPFDQDFEGERQDRDLPNKLFEEREGILAWLVEGAKRWYTTGLVAPERVDKAIASYRTSQDSVELFIEERCQRTGRVTKQDLFNLYSSWEQRAGRRPLGRNEFYEVMTQKGFKEGRETNKRVYLGLSLGEASALEDEWAA